MHKGLLKSSEQTWQWQKKKVIYSDTFILLPSKFELKEITQPICLFSVYPDKNLAEYIFKFYKYKNMSMRDLTQHKWVLML